MTNKHFNAHIYKCTWIYLYNSNTDTRKLFHKHSLSHTHLSSSQSSRSWRVIRNSRIHMYTNVHRHIYIYHTLMRGGGLGSRPKKMYGERLGDGVEYHLMKPTPRRKYHLRRGVGLIEFLENGTRPQPSFSLTDTRTLCHTHTHTHTHSLTSAAANRRSWRVIRNSRSEAAVTRCFSSISFFFVCTKKKPNKFNPKKRRVSQKKERDHPFLIPSNKKS